MDLQSNSFKEMFHLSTCLMKNLCLSSIEEVLRWMIRPLRIGSFFNLQTITHIVWNVRRIAYIICRIWMDLMRRIYLHWCTTIYNFHIFKVGLRYLLQYVRKIPDNIGISLYIVIFVLIICYLRNRLWNVGMKIQIIMRPFARQKFGS